MASVGERTLPAKEECRIIPAKDRFQRIAAAHLFLVKNQRVLLSQRANTGFEDGNYSVPAGHVDGGEQIRDAMIREAMEEIGVSIANDSLRSVPVKHRNCAGHERLDYFFSVTNWYGAVTNREPEKCGGLFWADLDGLPSNLIAYVRAAIAHYQNGVTFSESGW